MQMHVASRSWLGGNALSRRLRPLKFHLIFAAFWLLAWHFVVGTVEPALKLDRLVAEAFDYIGSHELRKSLGASFRRIGVAYPLAVLLAVPSGLAFGLLPKLEDLFDPVIAIIRPISPLGWLPLAIIWFGISNQAAIFIISYAVFFPVFLNTIRGVRNMPHGYREAALTFGASKLQILTRILLPAALPSILTGLRIGMGLAWSSIIAAELVIGFVLQEGIGYLMQFYVSFSYNLTRLLLLTLLIGLIGLLMDAVLRYAGGKLTPWRVGQRVGD